MKAVYQTIAIIVLALAMCFAGSSCSNDRSGNRKAKNDSNVKDSITFRVRQYNESTSTKSNITQLLKLPAGYTINDTIIVADSRINGNTNVTTYTQYIVGMQANR